MHLAPSTAIFVAEILLLWEVSLDSSISERFMGERRT